MLNRAEKFQILKSTKICSIIGCFPVTVDLSTWQLLPHSQTKKQLWPTVAYFGSFLLHVVYKVTTFLWACFPNKKTPLQELTIHGVMALGGPVMSFWYYIMYIEHPGVLGAYLQMTLTGNIGGHLLEYRGHARGTKRLKEYTPQDLMAIGLPYMAGAVVVMYLAADAYYPELQLLLYTGLPEKYKTWLSFAVLFLEEMRYMITFYVIAVPMWTLQLISFDLVNTRLRLLIHSIERASKADEIYKHLRHVQLYVTTINVVNRHIIFSWKVYCITICIGTGYAAIAHFTEHPVFGVLYYIILIDGAFIYTIIYGEAFQAPELFKQATQKALLLPCYNGHGALGNAHIVKRQMRSVPRVGIKVGEFHMMERHSVLIFVYYVLSNIVTMLVVCKR